MLIQSRPDPQSGSRSVWTGMWCIYVGVCPYVCRYICIRVSVCVRVSVLMCVCTCMSACVCVGVYECCVLRTCVCIVCVYVCIYGVYVRVYMSLCVWRVGSLVCFGVCTHVYVRDDTSPTVNQIYWSSVPVEVKGEYVGSSKRVGSRDVTVSCEQPRGMS